MSKRNEEPKYKVVFQAKVFKLGNSFVITIPKNIRDMYDIRKGDTLFLRILEIKRRRESKV